MLYLQCIGHYSHPCVYATVGGIFMDDYHETPTEVTLNYTMVANDLVLYKLGLSENTSVKGFKAKIDIEIHRRYIFNLLPNNNI